MNDAMNSKDKNLKDEVLPNRKIIDVEFACSSCGGMGFFQVLIFTHIPMMWDKLLDC